MALRFLYLAFCAVLRIVVRRRREAANEAEIVILRHEVAVLRRELIVRLARENPRWGYQRMVAYYSRERPHRGLGLRPPDPPPQLGTGPIQRLDPLGGLIHHYERMAA